jgi:ankyrin repeat protein
MRIPGGDELAAALLRAVHIGDVDAIRELLAGHPGLAGARIVGSDGGTSTPLHMVTDWPGYFPNGPEVVALLIGAGADASAPLIGADGKNGETPLHYAASSDDVDVARALVDGGADIEAPGGSITGTPLANAIGYSCWEVARLLAARGASIGELWEAAALGNRPRVDELLGTDPPPTAADLDEALWQACHGGQRRMAEYLLARGANVNATVDYASGTPIEVALQPDTQREAVVTFLREHGATTT